MRKLKEFKDGNNKKGITMISLVITVIVLIILAGISISILIGNNGIITKAREAELVSEFSKYNEELKLFKASKLTENINFSSESLSSGKSSVSYNTQTENDKITEKNIKSIIPDLMDMYIDNFEIIKGELTFSSQDKNMLRAAQI